MRRRRSTSVSSGTLIWNRRIALPSAPQATCSGNKLTAAAAAEVARTSRRVGDVACMTFSFAEWLAPERVDHHQTALLLRVSKDGTQSAPKASDRFAKRLEGGSK